VIPRLLLLGLLAAVVGGTLCFLVVRGGVVRRATTLFEAWRGDALRADTAISGRRSEAVLRGQIAEHLLPFSPAEELGFDLADARYLGQPIDFIIFDGYTDVRAGRSDRLKEIVFVDIKTGNATLSTVERRVRACVEAGRVGFVSLSADDVIG
jgi:predicted Holliday junction resolvase-like endonuclease